MNMKKNFKLVLALVVAIMMIMSSAALAADGSTKAHTITINNADQIGAHTYEAYQVFKGDYDATANNLSNIAWGTGVDGDAILAAVKADVATFGAEAANVKNAEDVAKLLGGAGTDTPKAKAFADIVGAHLGAAAGTSTGSNPYTIVVTGDGYYFIKDKDGTVPADEDDKNPQKGDAATRFILEVVKDTAVNAKSNTVESKKKVDDNDTDGTLIDSADYDIGDTIPYTLTFTLPSNYADYEQYYVKFTDKMDAGLTYNGDATIQYGTGDFTAFNFGATSGTAGASLAAEIENLKVTAPSMTAGQTITIKYTAFLNNNAKIGSTGNPNTYKVEFNNNPNNSGKGKPTGETPEDTNIVFTYKTVFNKVDENDAPLTGADFTLYKKVGSEWKDVTTLNTSASPSKTGSTAGSSFSFKGLDAGDYKLEETTTPDGYNSIAPIEFTITATHDILADAPTLKTLTGTAGAELTFTRNTADEDALTSSVLNKSGVVLPSTGGIGTTIFYVAGSIMVLAAAILLITKRRMGAED